MDEDIIRVIDHIKVDSIRENTLNAGTSFENNVINKGFIEFRQIAEPADPGANIGRLYKKTGSNGLYWKTDVGVTEINLLEGYRGILYDAVVDGNGSADYTTISAALIAGAQTVFVRDGNYTESVSLNIPNGGFLIGESKNAVITFTGAISGIVTDTSGGSILTIGTISVTNGSTTVNGTLTTFTTLNPVGTNTYIAIGNNSYLVASVTNNTTLVLSTTYRGATVSGITYKAHKVNNGFHIENLTIIGSNNGIYVRSARQAVISNVSLRNLLVGANIIHCDNSSFRDIIIENSPAGFILDSNISCDLYGCQSMNCVGVGINITGTSLNVLISNCNSSNNGGVGLNVAAPATNCVISESVFNGNNDKGINTDPGSITCTIIGCIVRNNASWGIDYDGLNNIIDTCVVDGNGNSGIRAGVDGIISNCQTSNNVNYGIELEADFRCVVSGNNVYSNTSHGIFCNEDNNDITGNVIRNNGGSGIYLTTASGNNITNNHISFNAVNGITVDTTSLNNNICGNTFNNNVIGCSVISGCNNTTMMGNMSRSNSSHGFSIAANTCMVSSNRSVGNGGIGCVIASGAVDVTVLSNNFQGNTGANFSDNGTITSLEGVLINSVDARSATTLALGATTATGVDISKTGALTRALGSMNVLQTLSADTMTELTLNNGVLIENVLNRDGYIEMNDISAPVNPGASKGRLYKKTGNDGIFWKPDAAGAEVDLTTPPVSYGISSSTATFGTITTTSATHVLATGMTFTPVAGTYVVIWSASVRSTSTTGEVYIRIYAGGSAVGAEQIYQRGGSASSIAVGLCVSFKVTVNGSQAIEGRWRRVNGTGEMLSRNLTIIQTDP